MIAPAIPIVVVFDGRLWRIRSGDGRLTGSFIDEKTARRQAMAEADAHRAYYATPPGHTAGHAHSQLEGHMTSDA